MANNVEKKFIEIFCYSVSIFFTPLFYCLLFYYQKDLALLISSRFLFLIKKYVYKIWEYFDNPKKVAKRKVERKFERLKQKFKALFHQYFSKWWQ